MFRRKPKAEHWVSWDEEKPTDPRDTIGRAYLTGDFVIRDEPKAEPPAPPAADAQDAPTRPDLPAVQLPPPTAPPPAPRATRAPTPPPAIEGTPSTRPAQRPIAPLTRAMPPASDRPVLPEPPIPPARSSTPTEQGPPPLFGGQTAATVPDRPEPRVPAVPVTKPTRSRQRRVIRSERATTPIPWRSRALVIGVGIATLAGTSAALLTVGLATYAVMWLPWEGRMIIGFGIIGFGWRTAKDWPGIRANIATRATYVWGKIQAE